MPRPRKCRRVCRLPQISVFAPAACESAEEVAMEVDEYEAIRLIDWEGLTQEEAALQMAVARTTVQAIYNRARQKLADCLVNGRRLVIGGGEFSVCDRENSCHRRGCCHRQDSCPREDNCPHQDESAKPGHAGSGC